MYYRKPSPETRKKISELAHKNLMELLEKDPALFFDTRARGVMETYPAGKLASPSEVGGSNPSGPLFQISIIM